MMQAVIHCEPLIQWQPVRARYFMNGLRRLGISYRLTDSRARLDEGFPILLGTSCWRRIEVDGGPFLLVDRCSFGDTEKFVSLVWNGHGRRGDHRVPANAGARRWESLGLKLKPWRPLGSRVVLCGQVDLWTQKYGDLDDWYYECHDYEGATHFRPHPACPGDRYGDLELARDFEDAIAVTLNSSIGVQCVLDGIPTVTMDEGSMAWPVTGHTLADVCTPEREPWCHWLAWTQWTDDEIREGKPWAHMLE